MVPSHCGSPLFWTGDCGFGDWEAQAAIPLRAMADKGIAVPAIVMTAQSSVASAVQAMRLGAQDYLVRPFDVDVLELAMERVLSRETLRAEHDFLRRTLALKPRRR